MIENKKPFFSVIIPTYNRSQRISKAIESVLNQSFSNWELILIDDASKDSTYEVILPYLEDERILYFKNETNLERCKSRNKGIELAKGNYICFLDSDDYHLPNHLEKIYDSIREKNNPIGFFFVNAWNATEEGLISERYCPDFEIYNPYTYFLRYTVNPQRWAVHREIFDFVKFDSEVVIAEDMDTSLRILEKEYPIFQIKERTTVYVAAYDSFTYSDSEKWEKELFYFQKIFGKEELRKWLPSKEKNRLLSMCYFHLSSNNKFNNKTRILYILRSFFYCPLGYNKRTNKILIYNLYSILIK